MKIQPRNHLQPPVNIFTHYSHVHSFGIMSISRFLVHVITQLRPLKCIVLIKAHHGILFCIVAIFGKVVPSTKAGVYAQPSTNYE